VTRKLKQPDQTDVTTIRHLCVLCAFQSIMCDHVVAEDEEELDGRGGLLLSSEETLAAWLGMVFRFRVGYKAPLIAGLGSFSFWVTLPSIG